MEKEAEHGPAISEKIVNEYFSIKMVEARLSGNEDYIRFMRASIRLWKHNRSLHVRLCQDIQNWHNSTVLLEEMLEYEPQPRLPFALRPAHAPLRVWWAFCGTTALLITLSSAALATGEEALVTATVGTTLMWLFTVHQLYLDRTES